MPAREFVGRSTSEILTEIRRRLGPDAMILGANEVANVDPASGASRLLGITACRSGEIDVAETVAEARPSGLRRLVSILRGIGVAEPVAREIIELTLSRIAPESISDTALTDDAALDAIAGRFPAVPAGAALATERRVRRLAFVGPSGAGKTTTLLKLASRLAAASGEVRVGAFAAGATSVSRLGAIAAAFGATVCIVEKPRDWKLLCKGMREGTALLDTGGVGAADAAGIAKIKTFLCDAGIDETHVVIPATIDPDEARELRAELTGTPSRRLLVTKIDEAYSVGRALAFLLDAGSEVSYIACGSDPAVDLVAAGAEQVRALASAAFHGASGRMAREALLRS
ncbi:MAG: hypothetical protein ACKVU1_09200 [bacterium]